MNDGIGDALDDFARLAALDFELDLAIDVADFLAAYAAHARWRAARRHHIAEPSAAA